VLLSHVKSNIFNFCGCLTKKKRKRGKTATEEMSGYVPIEELTDEELAWASKQAKILGFFAIGRMVYHGNGYCVVNKKIVWNETARPGLYAIPQKFCEHCSLRFQFGKPLPDQLGEGCVVPQLCPAPTAVGWWRNVEDELP
jgi:hypothetical protein